MNPTLPPVYSLAQALERMGPTVRERYGDLRALVSDAQALQVSLMERIDTAQEEFHRLQRRLGRASAVGDADEVKTLESDLAAAAAKLDRLEKERSKRNSVRANTEQICSRLDVFILSRFSGAGDVTYPPQITVRPALRDGESVTDAILRLRDEISRARGELSRVRAAPLPADEIRAAVFEQVDRLAKEGEPRLSIEGPVVRLQWPDVQYFSAPGQALVAPSGGASKLLRWLHRDAIIERLTANVVDAPHAIPAGERPARIRALEERLFVLEVEEEYFVAQAIAAGLEAHRRPDASPFAILGWGLQPQLPVAEAAE